MRCVLFRGIAVFILVSLSLSPTPVSSTLLGKQSDERLAKRAPLVVLGNATEAHSEWIDRRLVTLVKVQVSEILKGQQEGDVTVIVPGGIDTSRPMPIAQTVDGAPEFKIGERVLLFLKPVPEMPGRFLLVGSSQGKLTIKKGPAGLLAHRNLSGVQLYDGKGIQPGVSQTIPLRELRKIVQQVVGESRQDS